MHFGVLGSLEIREACEVITVGPLRQRTVLAALLVDAGTPVAPVSIIDRVWGAKAGPATAASLHAIVSRLRTVLGSAVIARTPSGYRLSTARSDVDWQHFTDLVAHARRLGSQGSVEPAREMVAAALNLWRGDAFADIPADFAQRAAADLAEQRLLAVGFAVDLDIAVGNYREVAQTVPALVREYPMREDLRGSLMLALYRSGRQGEALRVYQDARAFLAEELGVEPSPRLQRLHELILRQDPDLALEPPRAPDPTISSSAQTRPRDVDVAVRSPRVSVPLTPLIGRGQEVRTILDLLEQHRLLTIVGTGGIGKSRLALEVIAGCRAADGPWLVELTDVKDGALLAETIASAMGLITAQSVDALAGVLNGRDTLVVLDNCEQIAADVATVAAALLRACPTLRILTTSRDVLAATGEVVFQLQPLANLDAQQLFRERAGAASHGWFALDDERPILAEICRELDNLPLAIELAAAQTRAFSVRQLADLLADRFTLLSGRSPGHPRHATMIAAIEWSYASLTAPERSLFECLAVLEGTFGLDGARAAGGVSDFIGPLRALIDKSLVLVTGDYPRRYRMLETLRQYAALRRTAKATTAVHRRIAARFVEMAGQADEQLRGTGERAWMDQISADHASLRAALGWADVDVGDRLRIAAGVSWFWYLNGHIAAGIRSLDGLLAHADPAQDPAVTIRARISRALLGYLSGDLTSAIANLGQAGTLLPAVTDQDAAAYALATISYFEAASGQTEAALEHGTQALELADSIASPHRAADALQSLGMAHFRAGRFTEAEQVLSDGVERANSVGYRWCAGSAGWILTKVRISRGDLSTRTVEELRRIIDGCHAHGDITSWLVLVDTLAYVLFKQGHVQEAAELAGITQIRGESIGFSPAAMDPVDLLRYRREMESETPKAVWDSALCEGQEVPATSSPGRIREILDSVRPPVPLPGRTQNPARYSIP